MEYDLIQTPASKPVTDLIYEFTAVDDDFTSPPKGCKAITASTETDNGCPRVLFGNEGGDLQDEALTQDIRKHLCTKSKKHWTGGYWDKVDILCDPRQLSESLVWTYAEDSPPGVLLIQKGLASRMSTTFRGVKFSEGLRAFGYTKLPREVMPVVADECRIFQPHGRCWFRGLTVRGKPDACPHCGHGPIVCLECGTWNYECEICGLEMGRFTSESSGPDDKRLILSPPDERRDHILNGETWDGADFISGRAAWNNVYVTKRVVDFLLSIHATSFRAVPVIVDAAKMNDQQRKWMDEARRMPV